MLRIEQNGLEKSSADKHITQMANSTKVIFAYCRYCSDAYRGMEEREVENIRHCIRVRIDIQDIDMYQNILTYCYMAGMTHNMNQPMEIDTNVLYVSLVSCYLFGNGEW